MILAPLEGSWKRLVGVLGASWKLLGGLGALLGALGVLLGATWEDLGWSGATAVLKAPLGAARCSGLGPLFLFFWGLGSGPPGNAPGCVLVFLVSYTLNHVVDWTSWGLRNGAWWLPPLHVFIYVYTHIYID